MCIRAYLLSTPTAVTWVALSATFLRLSLRLPVFPHDISKINTARITKLDTELFLEESWKLIYFGVKDQRLSSRGTNGIAGVGHRAVGSDGLFYLTACTVVQAVVKATSQSNGKGQILTPWGSETLERISMKLGIYNRVAGMPTHANPCGAATTWVVWANT